MMPEHIIPDDEWVTHNINEGEFGDIILDAGAYRVGSLSIELGESWFAKYLAEHPEEAGRLVTEDRTVNLHFTVVDEAPEFMPEMFAKLLAIMRGDDERDD
ncbi:MAG: hypothetical protein RLP44_02440 [Aggregatilineales bacterium]